MFNFFKRRKLRKMYEEMTLEELQRLCNKRVSKALDILEKKAREAAIASGSQSSQ